MRFTLHYEGPLPARGGKLVKASVREAFEDQLNDLWSRPPLSLLQYLDPGKPVDQVSALIDRYGHTFAALVSDAMGLSAELDVLMLRPSAPGHVVNGGDIDNRVKTLLDALSAPAQANQIPNEMRNTSAQAPMFVLLEDDKHVTRLNVETERLLAPVDPDVVHLTVRVTTRLTKWMWANISLDK